VNRRIGIPETGTLHVEITISDFPTRSETLIRRTCVRGSRGIGVRHFKVSEGRGIVTPGIAISRNAIARQSELWAPEGVIGGDKCRRASDFGTWKVLWIGATEIVNSRNAISRFTRKAWGLGDSAEDRWPRSSGIGVS
jgi:hypothetical protein